MRLSVVCANVYAGMPPIEFMLRNLAAQTFRDFELVLVDAFYRTNATAVAELSNLLGIDTIHVPACEAKHVGRWLHWELYNNGALLANNPWVVYHGVYRYLHRQALETIAGRSSCGITTVLGQKWVDTCRIGSIPDSPESAFDMNVACQGLSVFSHTGFFAAQRELIIHTLNGYNEALVNDHWVDCDMSARATHISVPVEILPSALLRIARDCGHYGMIQGQTVQSSGIGKPTCTVEKNPECIMLLLNARQTYTPIDGRTVDRVQHKGFEWVRCSECGTLSVENPDAYIHHLRADSSLLPAPINVSGVGRNLSTVAGDFAGLGLASRVGILISSHNNPRYLQ